MSKKVSVKTLRDLLKDKQGNNVVEIEIDGGVKIEVAKSLDVTDRIAIADSVVQQAFMPIDNGGVLFEYNEKIEDATLTYYCMSQYTNINLPKNLLEAYDLVEKLGIRDKVFEVIELDIADISYMIESKRQEQERLQELKCSIGYKLEDTIQEITDKVSSGLETLKSINPDELKVLTSFLNDEQKDIIGENRSFNMNEQIQKPMTDTELQEEIARLSNNASDMTKISKLIPNAEKVKLEKKDE